jgi:hypothetical protein
MNQGQGDDRGLTFAPGVYRSYTRVSDSACLEAAGKRDEYDGTRTELQIVLG